MKMLNESNTISVETLRQRFVDAAIWYLELGLRPIPIVPGDKMPPAGFNVTQFRERPPSDDEIREWAALWPDAGIGILTGKPSGLMVIDEDVGHVPWPPPGCELPPAFVVQTPRGGRHYYMKHLHGIASSVSVLAKGIDVRADAGHIVMPPSPGYTIVEGNLAAALECDAPQWLKDALLATSKTSVAPPTEQGEPDSEVIPEGRRNSTLLSLAGSMRRRGKSEDEIYATLKIVNTSRCRPPLPEKELRGIAEYVGNKEVGTANQGTPEEEPDCYFEDRTFVILRLARAIESNGTYLFGRDPDGGGGRLMQHANGVWRPAINVEVEAHTRLGERSTPSRLTNTRLTLEKDVKHVPWSAWNPERRLVNCLSGMLDPATMQLLPHDPKYLSTMQIPLKWDPEADTEMLRRWMDEMLPPDCVELVQQMMGYLLIPDVSIKKLFIFVGPGDTGKTTLIVIIQNLVGPDNFEIIELRDFSDNRFASARLENKLVGLYDDLQATRLQDTSVVKTLTGGSGWLVVERKGVDAYKAPLYARLIYAANEVPGTQDKSDAWLNRCLIIPMRHVIPEGKKDSDLKTRLSTGPALQGAFRFAVEGLSKLLANGMRLPEPATVKDAVKRYESANDTVAAFLEEGCERGDPAITFVAKTSWYAEYQRWCEAMGLRFVAGKKKAYERLRSLGIQEGMTGPNRTRVFAGIRISAAAWDEIEHHKHAKEQNHRR